MTAQKPRFPKHLWLSIRCTFQPLPDAPPGTQPIQLHLELAASHDGRGTYTVDNANPLAWIQHGIYLSTGDAETAGTITADLATHQPYNLGPTAHAKPEKWHPYRLTLDIPQPDPPAPDSDPDLAYWDSRPPSQRLPATLAACRLPTGPYGARILERRSSGPRARAQALARSTPSPKQQLQQARFTAAKSVWAEYIWAQRLIWNDAARILGLPLTGWNLFLQHTLAPDAAEFERLKARCGLPLPQPPVVH
jgi:hypothetical protein